MEEYINEADYLAFDCETTGTDKEASIIGFSVSADAEIGYYCAVKYYDKDDEKLYTFETEDKAFEILLKIKTKKLIMHNAVFDCMMVESNYNVKLMPSLHTDTMILAHLLDENRRVGLKDLALALFGADSVEEQKLMKASVLSNGGKLTKAEYELYKADYNLIGEYGAKDTLLTFKLFIHLVEKLYETDLVDFFYNDESMPLLKETTYDLNNTGVKVNQDKLRKLKSELEAECMQLKADIYKEISPLVKHKYPAESPKNTFNIGSGKQIAWLVYSVMGKTFNTLTKEGKNVCKALGMSIPYTAAAKAQFIRTCLSSKGEVYDTTGRGKKVGDYWNYLSADKGTLAKFNNVKWIKSLLEYSKALKLLNTYVEGIQKRQHYGVIYPSFLQHGTTSGRYSSRNPNFQNLPRDDKRVKGCIEARPGRVFVGADYSQLEPRVFASFSGDERLLASFKNGDDFYSVIGMEIFDKYDCSLKKEDKDSFANKYPALRNMAKTVGLAAAYGTTPAKMAPAINKSIQECKEIIDSYFEKFPKVKTLMLDSHKEAILNGYVKNLYGRQRRMPQAMDIPKIYGKTPHEELPYEARNILNLAINHRIQSTGASIVNRASIAFKRLKINSAKIVLQVHDEIVVECDEAEAGLVRDGLKFCMQDTIKLPGVDLIAEPKIGKFLSDLK